jgi:hypothetical protein
MRVKVALLILAVAVGSGVLIVHGTTVVQAKDDAPTLTVNVVVVNDDGGTAVEEDFTILVDGNPLANGVPGTLPPGEYEITLEQPAGPPPYGVEFTGDCEPDGSITLIAGQSGQCTITFDDGAVGASVPALNIRTLSGALPESGFAFVIADGGLSVADLGRAMEPLNLTIAVVLHGGRAIVFIREAPDFVNAEFLDLFPKGLPLGQILTVKVGPALTPPPTTAPNGLAGTVVDSAGQPIEGVGIALTMGSTRVDVRSGADGAWSVELPASGGWTWSVVGVLCTSRIHNSECQNDSFFLRNPRGAVSVPGDPGPTVVYELASRTIVGTTVDLAGGPLAGVRVRATRSDGAMAFVSTDVNGQFTVPAGPGTWTVWASFGQLVSNTFTIELGAAPTSAPLTLRLPLPGSGAPLPPVGDGTLLTVNVNGDSRAYDFRALILYPGPTDGDFYFSGAGLPAFWANNRGMRGLVDLGAIATPLDEIVPPATGYTDQGVPAVIGHIYVSPARDGFEGEHIIFRVLNIETDGTDVLSYEIEYLYRDGGG